MSIWYLATGHWSLVTGHWSLASHRFQVSFHFGFRILDFGFKKTRNLNRPRYFIEKCFANLPFSIIRTTMTILANSKSEIERLVSRLLMLDTRCAMLHAPSPTPLHSGIGTFSFPMGLSPRKMKRLSYRQSLGDEIEIQGK
jgi:hypothetical protein